MSIVIDGTLGVSAVQDGVVSESKIVSGAVTDTKLTLTPNSQEIKDALNATGSTPIYACRAWVNFNGTGTVTIRASGNVSSITDTGTGDYSVNFITAMPNENYSSCSTAKGNGASGPLIAGCSGTTTNTASVSRIYTMNYVGTSMDSLEVNHAVFC